MNDQLVISWVVSFNFFENKLIFCSRIIVMLVCWNYLWLSPFDLLSGSRWGGIASRIYVVSVFIFLVFILLGSAMGVGWPLFKNAVRAGLMLRMAAQMRSHGS